jgi:uncharacterized protein (TIGR03067 family)
MSNRTRLVLMLVAFVSGMMLTGCQNLEQKEIARLQGTWEAFYENSENPKRDITFLKNNFKFNDTISGPFKINPEAEPKEIDITFDKSTDKELVGKILTGIYKIENGKLFLAYTQVEVRPETFENSDGVYVLVCTKHKK